MLSSKIVNCDLKDIKACTETAKAMVKYASDIFPTQFKKDPDGIWTSPLVSLGNI